ncbi:Diuretic hormone class 2 [Fragariocoptes setiger]|uniref:Diuretic hormone class 2 n=1 Tax=Fragariocoptes setiger TaxID=1670756 RepID=A0ABQ7S8D5_9ACAR|nr:Diuretic hormone class 2 [Fragariocoptes setiger]
MRLNTSSSSLMVAVAFAMASIMLLALSAHSMPLTSDSNSAALIVVEYPEQVVRTLEYLIRDLQYSMSSNEAYISNVKRGLDLGINRGFSGSQAGKHLMGLSAASYAGGPGK